MKQSVFDFNKEILFGEIGALVSAPLAAYFTSLVTANTSVISSTAVLSSIVGASLFWILMRTYDEKIRKVLSVQHLATDIGYFTPAAFFFAACIYYPALFLISRHRITQDYHVVYAVIISQVVAFSLYLVAMNIYHHFLWKFAKIDL